MTACATTYDDFDHLDHWEDIETVDQSEDERFFLYAYFEDCPACDGIKDDVFDAARNAEDPVYFIDVHSVEGEPTIDFPGAVPALYVFEERELSKAYDTNTYEGPNLVPAILEALEKIEAGDYW